MATLKTLATELGISVMAVSKALRDAPDISVRTKERVREAAKRHNYTPNLAAQNLRLQKSGLLGVIIPNVHHTYYSHLVWGVERQADSEGFQLLLAHSLDRPDVELEQVRKLLARRVEGLLIVPVARWQNRFESIEAVDEANVPLALLDRYPAGIEKFDNLCTVVHKDQSGAETATNHLIELGHQHIVCLAGPNGSSSSAARMMGYRRAMSEASKAEYDDHNVFLAGVNIADGEKAMAKVIDEGVPATAIVAFNDSVAMGAINYLLQQGIRVPEDVSVVGFGDGVLAANFRVPLSTMRQAKSEIGSSAVQLIRKMIQGDPVEPRLLPVELVTRQSSGKAPTVCVWAKP